MGVESHGNLRVGAPASIPAGASTVVPLVGAFGNVRFPAAGGYVYSSWNTTVPNSPASLFVCASPSDLHPSEHRFLHPDLSRAAVPLVAFRTRRPRNSLACSSDSSVPRIGSTAFLARRLGQVSEVGKFLDPLADRLAIAAAVIGGWVAGVLPPWFAAAILVREALVATGALPIAVRAHAKLDVRRFGKVATFSLYFAIPAFFVQSGGWHDFFESFAWVTGGVGLVLYWWVAAQYTRDMVAILRGASPAVSSSGQGDAT